MAASDIKAKLVAAIANDKRAIRLRSVLQLGHGTKKDAFINLTNKAIVTSGVDMVIPVTGTYATKIKLTIVNGIVIGAVLS